MDEVSLVKEAENFKARMIKCSTSGNWSFRSVFSLLRVFVGTGEWMLIEVMKHQN
jgi:hypothetical protein